MNDRQADQSTQSGSAGAFAYDQQPDPLSFGQEQLWIFEQMSPGTTVYNVPLVYRCRGVLDVAALREALSAVVARHEVLRTRYVTEQGVPRQVFDPPCSVDLALDTVPGPTAHLAERQAVQLATTEARTPFDLAHGPVFRARLIRLGSAEHLLCLTVHHIAADGWSMAVLGQELSEVYRAVAAGREPVLGELPVQYADYAIWQRDWLREEVLEKTLGYWQERLAGLPVLELPADRPRPTAASARGDLVTAEFSGELLDRLRVLARERGVSLFMVLVAGFAVVLARYTGQEDVPIGTTVLGRVRPELEQLVGLFVNEVVLRVDVAGDPRFTELLERVREVTLGAYDHQEAPFAKVVERVAPARDPGRNPLFQVLLQLFTGRGAHLGVDLPGVATEALDVHQGGHFLDLSLTFTEERERLGLLVEYAVDLFDRWRVEGCVRHLERVLRAVSADPGIRVSEVELVSEAERAELLGAGRGPVTGFRAEPVHVVAAERAARAPEAVAAVCRGEQLSYGELDRRALRLAWYLRSLGVGHQDVVAVAVGRGLDVLVALLGVLKAGAAFVVLDVSHPVRRLEFILADTRAVAVVTSEDQLAGLPSPAGWTAVCLDRDRDAIAASAGEGGLKELATAGSLAYVLYTSGSTGSPKGVLVEHRALMMYTAAFSALVDAGPGARLLQYPSLFFDLSLAEVFTTLTSGGTLVLVPEDMLLAPKELAALMRRERVTYIGAPPPMMALLEAGPYPELRTVLVGGEAFPGDLVNQWNQPGRRFINSYGPTETVVTCTAYVCEHITWRSSPPIGTPLPHRRLYVVDSWGKLAPAGIPGELLIGGDEGLARGYLNQPEQTAQRFVPDPFRGQGRVYRSGDLVRWSPRHQLEFIRRTDTQVKLRGLRIELGEIEAALAAHPQVGAAAVLLREDTSGEKYLAGYIAHTGSPPSPESLRAHIARDLPPYMLPSAWVIMDTLPLAPSGKVNRAALPAPARPQPAYTPPSTPAEEQVAAVFAEVLSLPRAGAHDNFFELGGNSLQAIRVISRLEDIFGVTLSVRHFYNTQATVTSVAEMLGAGPGTRGDTAGLRDLQADQWMPRAPVVPIAVPSAATDDPLFCVPAVSGSGYSYAGLAHELATTRAVYAFEAPGLDDDRPPASTVEELAREYLTSLLQRQPDGPYLLVGWSMGGLVAYEIATQLIDDGKGAPLLVLIDSIPPTSARLTDEPPEAVPAGAEIVQQFVGDLARAAGRPGDGHAAWPGRIGELNQDDPRPLLAALQKEDLVPPEMGMDLLRRRFEVFRASLLAMYAYRPRGRYPGSVSLIRAAESPDTSRRWRELAAHADCHIVPGDHYSMWDSAHMPMLAGTLRRCLATASQRAFGPDSSATAGGGRPPWPGAGLVNRGSGDVR